MVNILIIISIILFIGINFVNAAKSKPLKRKEYKRLNLTKNILWLGLLLILISIILC